MPMPRIESLSVQNLTGSMLATLSQIPGDALKSKGFPSNVLGTLLHNPETLDPFLSYWVSSKHTLSLSIREQELVILRMGKLYASEYVWKHHVLVGREFGISDAELDALRLPTGAYVGMSHPSLCGAEIALLVLTDELVDKRTITDAGWERYGMGLGPKTIIDLIALVSQYTLFALVNNSAAVIVEDSVSDLPSVHG